MTHCDYSVSGFTRTYTDKKLGTSRLDMRAVTGFEELTSFEAVCEYVLKGLRYPLLQGDKLETYAWVPTLYTPSERSFTNATTGKTFTRFGSWRNAEAEADALTLFYADVDNSETARPLVTMQSVANALDGLGLSYFMYTSFSHTAEKPKFRVVIDTDRHLSRTEMLRVAVGLNWTAFGQQADLSIYDPGDFVFAPPHSATVMERLHAMPLSVDAALAQQKQLQEQHPGSWTRYVAVKQRRLVQSRPTPAQTEAVAKRLADRTVRPEIGIHNPGIFNPAWSSLYPDRVTEGSHWMTMRSLLGMVWAKTGGTLSYGEMDHLLRQIDDTAANYLIQRHGETKAAELITWIMSLPVEPEVDDWSPLLDRDDTSLTVLVKEGECGEGKTRDELQRMAREKGRYVYVVDKIENIEKRRQEFFEVAGPWIALRFCIKEAHSLKQELRVALQLNNIRNDLNNEPAGRAAIVFVTQAGATVMDWSRWGDFEIIFDEVPDCFQVFKIDAKNHAEEFRRYVRVEGSDGACYSLGLTGAGRDLARNTDVDDYDKVHHGLCVLMAKPNTYVWVKRTAWDDPSAGGRLEFFAITSPLNLSHFTSVRLLGDEAMKSVTVKTWSEKWGVTFTPLDFDRRKRIVPTSDRVTIRYFSDHRDSSITRFREGDMPLEAMTKWIKQDAGQVPVLWSTNERLRAKAKLDQQDFISPKAHGRNDLQHYKRVAWLTAMKASKFEVGTLREVCGMTAADLTEWREYNVMYQFVMRCVLRDFSSAEPVVIYVFSRKQAEYLRSRLSGTIEKVPGIVIDKPVRCTHEDGPMTEKERSKALYWRDKMRKAGVCDVRLLPKATKLTDREIRLVNATFGKQAMETAPIRIAA